MGDAAENLDRLHILEVVAVMLSTGAVSLPSRLNGKTNWFEGLQLLAVYAILAVAFYYI